MRRIIIFQLFVLRMEQCSATVKSWIEVHPDSHFHVQNLPWGIFSTAGVARAGTIVGETVIDLAALYEAGVFADAGLPHNVFAESTLNSFMELTRPVWRAVRATLTLLLVIGGNNFLSTNEELKAKVLIPASEVTMHLPARISEYTDFYSSREHATNVGIMFRGVDNALQPNWLHLPVGYHGRASSVVVSGTDIIRPCGQLQKTPTDPKEGSIFGACRLLDFELEMGFFVGGPANPLGTPITMEQAEDRIFGVVLLNDWSARDIQAWEYVPLGPFTAKNFATSISPWVVTLDALDPFRCESSAGEAQTNPVPLPYLVDPDYHRGTFDVKLEVAIKPTDVEDFSTVSVSNYKYLYWNMKQQLVHHTVTGATMRAGDLLGSGTISGPTEDSFGSMLELSWKGAKEVPLKNANTVRKFLQDGDSVSMGGYAQGDGYRVGFGEVVGKILPATNPYLAK